jgi:DNA helicase-2/ATP-dependent DNA helicase PcrA
MSRGNTYLEYLEKKLKKRIQEMDDTIRENEKDIGAMNEYYWENYTEMDQYGYENFDNQQALLNRVNANTENQKYRARLHKMLDAPFFGSVDFIYEGEDEPETFYIGIGNFAEKLGGIPLVYDWRAPVSGLFYDFDKGPAYYDAPAGRLEGEINSKWQYKIRHGKLIYEFESDMKIDDEILMQELGANSDVKLKNIVSTIQKEQNAIIRNTKDKILVIQGAAGSGKTSVALHRIAYLLYHSRKNLKSSNILILSPNSVFADYISHILPELGEENIREMSFDLFAYRELQDVARDCEDRYYDIEKRIRISDDKAQMRGRWKQSEQYVQAVEGFLVELEDRLVDFRDVELKGLKKKAQEILELFYFKFTEVPLLSRMDAVMEYVIDEYETLRGRNLDENEQLFLEEQFRSMYVTTDICEIYNWLLEEYGYETLPEQEREKRVLDYEDVYPVLYLKYRLKSTQKFRDIRHLVIDEMQDYSYLQYVILERLFSCNMTILGDRAQTLDDHPADVREFLPHIFGKKIRTIEMNRSYRNTVEIARYAAAITGVTGVDYLERHGKEVEEIEAEDLQSGMQAILDRIRVDDETYETAAVLTMTEQEAEDAYCYLKGQGYQVSLIDRDSSKFEKGITVTTYYLAKGLEFDQVFVLGGNPDNAYYSQYQYISATRALHELYIVRKI